MSAHRGLPATRGRAIALLLLLSCLAAGCTAAGYVVGGGSQGGSGPSWGSPLDLDRAQTIARGTPVQVGLPDGGYVRGIWLGIDSGDTTVAASTRLLLGVGNRIQIDRQFESGKPLAALTTAHVPDTLRFASDGVRELRVPGSSRRGQMTGAAVGLGIDLTIVALIGVGGLLAWLISRGM